MSTSEEPSSFQPFKVEAAESAPRPTTSAGQTAFPEGRILEIEKYTFGVGDRFAHQASSQLEAFRKLADDGIEVVPVWNKSNREHSFVGSQPQSVYEAAVRAVDQVGWKKPWHIDADHINLSNVDKFIPYSDFFTIDVAESIGKASPDEAVNGFIKKHPELIGSLNFNGLSAPLHVTADDVRRVANRYLAAAKQAGEIYRHIAAIKGDDQMIAEVSMDETDSPQTPPELLIILAAMADEGIPVQTIAPKFTGRFNKGLTTLVTSISSDLSSTTTSPYSTTRFEPTACLGRSS